MSKEIPSGRNHEFGLAHFAKRSMNGPPDIGEAGFGQYIRLTVRQLRLPCDKNRLQRRTRSQKTNCPFKSVSINSSNTMKLLSFITMACAVLLWQANTVQSAQSSKPANPTQSDAASKKAADEANQAAEEARKAAEEATKAADEAGKATEAPNASKDAKKAAGESKKAAEQSKKAAVESRKHALAKAVEPAKKAALVAKRASETAKKAAAKAKNPSDTNSPRKPRTKPSNPAPERNPSKPQQPAKP